jgi:hypothetical protein
MTNTNQSGKRGQQTVKRPGVVSESTDRAGAGPQQAAEANYEHDQQSTEA